MSTKKIEFDCAQRIGIANYYLEGKSAADIAVLYGCSDQTILRTLKRMRIKARARADYSLCTNIPEYELRREYLVNQKTLEQIGQRFGVSRCCVRDWFIRLGIKRRPRGRGGIPSWVPWRYRDHYSEIRRQSDEFAAASAVRRLKAAEEKRA
jgi:transposase